MASFNITVSDAEEKVLLRELKNAAAIQAWLDNAIQNKARRCMDVLITQETTERVDLLSREQKEIIVNRLF